MKNIHEELKKELKEAMKAKEETKLSVIRDLVSSFSNEAVANGNKPDTILSDEDALTVIKRKAKQRKDSIESFEKANRDDLIEKEKAELEIIEEYLPEQLSDEKLEEIIGEVIEETGASSMADMGQVMGKAMEKVGAQADGNRVSEIVKNKLQ